MKLHGKLTITVVGGLIVISPVFAAATDGGSNPYQTIVVRNVFGLKDPVPEAPPPPPEVPKGKISLQGITDILGRKQVLLKIQTPARPPDPAKEESYVLSEGERAEDVEVVSIDHVNGVVELLNAGVRATLTMEDNAAEPSKNSVAPPPVPAAAVSARVISTPGLRQIPTRPIRSSPPVPPPPQR